MPLSLKFSEEVKSELLTLKKENKGRNDQPQQAFDQEKKKTSHPQFLHVGDYFFFIHLAITW